MPAKIVLVTGGARSGKSEFAEKYVLHYGAKCAYIATAENALILLPPKFWTKKWLNVYVCIKRAAPGRAG